MKLKQCLCSAKIQINFQIQFHMKILRNSFCPQKKRIQVNNCLSNFLLIKRSGNDEAWNFSTVNRVNLSPSSGQPFFHHHPAVYTYRQTRTEEAAEPPSIGSRAKTFHPSLSSQEMPRRVTRPKRGGREGRINAQVDRHV